MSDCVVCDSSLNQIKHNYDFNLVTSDCRIWYKRAQLAYCNSCGLVQRPRTAEWREECIKIYSDYEPYRQGAREEPKTFDSRGLAESRSSKLLKYFLSEFNIYEGEWLDYGCGDGSFLRMLSSLARGFRLSGFDVSYHNKSIVENEKTSFFSNLSNINKDFQVISLIHVFEHLDKPIEELLALKQCLHDDGLLLIQVPSYELHPFDLTVYDHGCFFSIETLTFTLKNAGFEVVQITSSVIHKEITAVCKKAIVNSGVVPKNTSEQLVESSLMYLDRILSEAIEHSKLSPINIFGTSIGATWLTGNLERDKIRCYLDEDLSRVGHILFEKDILAPNAELLKNAILPLSKDIVNLIRRRFKL
ncbi:MAG: class I SAM-dependent methyltransferase [Oscillatoria sp. SIO1A7]|nr:class I SAM-dependent methyltransferase [Oscillatoria sp. SIO1A7]